MVEFTKEALQESAPYLQYRKVAVTYQKYLDQSVPFTVKRWIGFGVLFTIFFLRILTSQGWYVICYGLGIYLLNLLLAFLTPKFDPSLEQEMKNEDIEEGIQDQEAEDEFRPFIRRLPEFKFWYNATRATAVSFFCSLWTIFDVPVFWPILLMYFIILFTLTMRRQVQHMIKYKYLPFDIGKTKYTR
jgi:hypothetical protein